MKFSQWASEQMIQFWWQWQSRSQIRIRITTLLRRALAEVCTVPVLQVNFCSCSAGLLLWSWVVVKYSNLTKTQST